MQCHDCHRTVEPDWKACPFCGATQRAQCSNCGKDLQPDWVVCPSCTTPIEPTTIVSGTSSPLRHETPTVSDLWQATEQCLEAVGDEFDDLQVSDSLLSDLETACLRGARDLVETISTRLGIPESVFKPKEVSERMIDELKVSAGKTHAAHLEVEKANIPDSTLEAMWQGAKTAVTDPTTAMATVLVPGLGGGGGRCCGCLGFLEARRRA